MRKLLDGLSRFSICITHAYLPRGRCDLEGQVISGPGAKKGFRKYTWGLIVPVGLLPLCLSLATVFGIGLDPAERYAMLPAALYFDLPLGAISTGIAAYGFMHRSSWSDVRLYGVFSAVTLIAVVAVAGVVFPAAWSSPLGSLKDSLEDWLGGHQNASNWAYILLATSILTGAPLVYWSFIMQRRRKTLIPRAFALSGSLVFFVGLVFARTAGPYMIVVSGILILTGVLMWVFERTNRKLLTDDGMAQFER